MDQDQHDPASWLGAEGERLVDKVLQGKWKTAKFLAALRNDRIDAPCLFDGPINGERFRAYVEQFLVPTLKPGDAVILDTLKLLQGEGGAEGHPSCRRPPRLPAQILPRLPTPPSRSSPSSRLCCEKAEARSYEAISDASGKILAQYPPAECAAYLKNAGYG